MDFDKLKKAARETFKIVSSKKDEKKDETKSEEVPTEPDNFSAEEEKEDTMGLTQRIDLKNVLDIFKKKKFTNTDQDESETPDAVKDDASESDLNAEDESETETETETETDILPTSGKAPAAFSDNSIDELKQALDILGSKLDAVMDKDKSEISDLNKAITELSGSIAELYSICTEENAKQDNLSNAIISQLGDTDKKLKSISNSISGTSKLGDSIFDLKNSQMNTKNALGNLEASFYKLKKKMTSSVLIISILTAVIAILEIINLLS
ncbi:MAG: hypothetical protein J1G06_02695 [Oscillospiraceae bacterium]|nr:hypothetical protein [Oscillospiraceae bacterium]